jgi:hypothetical protein
MSGLPEKTPYTMTGTPGRGVRIVPVREAVVNFMANPRFRECCRMISREEGKPRALEVLCHKGLVKHYRPSHIHVLETDKVIELQRRKFAGALK